MQSTKIREHRLSNREKGGVMHTVYGDTVLNILGPHDLPEYVWAEIVNPFTGRPCKLPVRRDIIYQDGKRPLLERGQAK